MKKIFTIAISLVAGITIGYLVAEKESIPESKEYYNAVEKVLDECDRMYNICDTIGEGDIYAEYVEAREDLERVL